MDSNIKKSSDKQFLAITAVVIHVSFHLATSTNFLGIQYKRDRVSDKDIALSLANNKNAQFVGGLLMHLLMRVKSNNIVVSIH